MTQANLTISFIKEEDFKPGLKSRQCVCLMDYNGSWFLKLLKQTCQKQCIMCSILTHVRNQLRENTSCVIYDTCTLYYIFITILTNCVLKWNTFNTLYVNINTECSISVMTYFLNYFLARLLKECRRGTS